MQTAPGLELFRVKHPFALLTITQGNTAPWQTRALPIPLQLWVPRTRQAHPRQNVAMPPPPSSLHSCPGQHSPSSAGCKAKDSPPAPKTLCGTPGIMLALPQTPLRKVAWDNVEPFSHYSPSPEPRGKPADFLGCSIREEQGRATQEGQQGLNNQPLAAPSALSAPSSRTPAGTGAWYTTAPAVPHAANETAALHPPRTSSSPAAASLPHGSCDGTTLRRCCRPGKGPRQEGQGLELLHSDHASPLPQHLAGENPGQVPDATYTAQCNGVKGFPSRYANGLCSSNNSRQSSCPVRREGQKYISAQPAVPHL